MFLQLFVYKKHQYIIKVIIYLIFQSNVRSVSFITEHAL